MRFLDAITADQATALAGLGLCVLSLINLRLFLEERNHRVIATQLYRRAAARERAAAAFLRAHPDHLKRIEGRVLVLEISEHRRRQAEEQSPLERVGVLVRRNG